MGLGVGKLAPAVMVGWVIPRWCLVDFVSHPFCAGFLEIRAWVEVVGSLGVGRGIEGHLLIATQFTAVRDKWLAGCIVMVENRPRQLNPGFIVVTGQCYSLHVIDMDGKKRQALLQLYSKN